MFCEILQVAQADVLSIQRRIGLLALACDVIASRSVVVHGLWSNGSLAFSAFAFACEGHKVIRDRNIVLHRKVTAIRTPCVQFTRLRTSTDDDASMTPPSSPSASHSTDDDNQADANEQALQYGRFKWQSNGEGWSCTGGGEDCTLLVGH